MGALAVPLASTAASWGVNKGLNALFSDDVKSVNPPQNDPASTQAQMRAQMLQALMQQHQQQSTQMPQPQMTTSIDINALLQQLMRPPLG